MPPTLDQLIGEIRAEEREREVREVDLAQQSPGQAQAQAEQSVQRADEDARENGLREQRRLGSVIPAGCSLLDTISFAPGAATSFGHTTTQRPFCTCLTRIRSSP